MLAFMPATMRHRTGRNRSQPVATRPNSRNDRSEDRTCGTDLAVALLDLDTLHTTEWSLPGPSNNG